MRKSGLTIGWSAAGMLALACGMCSAQATTTNQTKSPSLSDVAKSLAGEWEGQIQVRAADGSLSTSLASMSGKLHDGGNEADLYYEGFAFGKPVDGAMVLSFDAKHSSVAVADQAVRLHAKCEPQAGGTTDALSALGQAKGRQGEVRTLFSNDGADAWTIEYQSKDKDGNWSSMLTMHLSRMDEGKRSAAADSFASSPLLRGLHGDSASAAVDSDR